MRIKFLIPIAISFLTIACNDNDENISANIFNSQIGTEWIYLENGFDTTRWTFTRIKNINGIECAEITVKNSLVTNIYYYYQAADKIMMRALELPRIRVDLTNPDYSDTLIILNSPSMEYVYNRQKGYSWDRTLVTLIGSSPSDIDYKESRFKMTILGRETITTKAGTFDCQKIQDEVGQIHYVSDKGLIKKSFTTEINNQMIEFKSELIKLN